MAFSLSSMSSLRKFLIILHYCETFRKTEWMKYDEFAMTFRNTWSHDHIAATVVWKMLIIALRKYVFLWSMYFLQIEPHVHTKHLQGRIKVRKLQPMGDGCFSRYNIALLQLSPGFSLSPSVNISLLQQVLYEAPHSTKLWHYHVFLEVMSMFFWARQSHACTSRFQVTPLLVWQTTERLLQNLAITKKDRKSVV